MRAGGPQARVAGRGGGDAAPGRAWCTASGGLALRPIWDRAGPLSARQWERVRMYPYLTERMLHQSAALAPLGDIAVQHRERTGRRRIAPRPGRRRHLRPAGCSAPADCYQSMREPGRTGPHRRRRTRPSGCAPRSGAPPAGRPRRSTPCWPPPACGCPAAARPWPAYRPRSRGAHPARPRPVQQGDRAAAGDHAQDRGQPRGAHLRQDRRPPAGPRRPCSRCSGACCPKRLHGPVASECGWRPGWPRSWSAQSPGSGDRRSPRWPVTSGASE